MTRMYAVTRVLQLSLREHYFKETGGLSFETARTRNSLLGYRYKIALIVTLGQYC